MARDDGRVRERLGNLSGEPLGNFSGGPLWEHSGGPLGTRSGGPLGTRSGGPLGEHSGGPLGTHSGGPLGEHSGGSHGTRSGEPLETLSGEPFWGQGGERCEPVGKFGGRPLGEYVDGPAGDGRWGLDEGSLDSGDWAGSEAAEPRPDSADGVPLPTPPWLSEPVGSVSFWHGRLVPERFRGVRLDPGRRGVLALALVGVAAVVVAGAAAQRERPVVAAVPALPSIVPGAALTTVSSSPSPVADSRSPEPPPRAEDLVVSVVGLVEHPGLLHIPAGSRVADALAQVGAADGADLTSLNLAQKLVDGDQIVVGATGPASRPVSAVQTGGAPAGVRAPGAAPRRVSLNTATEADLDALPGVGESTARAILAWRTEHGRFTTVDQLGEVAGIGPSRLARLRALVTL